MPNGWVKLSRKVWDNPRVAQNGWLSVWTYLLCTATYKPIKKLFGGSLIELKPGQLVTGRNVISSETGVNRSTVDRVLACMESEHQIEQQMSNKSRLISIKNWEKYQGEEIDEPQIEPQMSRKRAATEPQLSTLQEEKKERIEEEKEDPHAPDKAFFDVARKAYPGDRRGLDAEWANFKSKNQNYAEPLLLLLPAVEKEIVHKAKLKATPGAFCPPWANFSTWINQKRWTQEFGEVSNGVNGKHPQQFESAQQRKDRRIREEATRWKSKNGGDPGIDFQDVHIVQERITGG